MNQVVYQAYSPAHSYLKKSLPYLDLAAGEKRCKPPKLEYVPRKKYKIVQR